MRLSTLALCTAIAAAGPLIAQEKAKAIDTAAQHHHDSRWQIRPVVGCRP